MKPLSLTARISLLFAGVAVIVLLGIGWVLTMAVEAHFKGEDTAEIQGKFELIAHLLGKAHDQDTFDALAQELDDALVGHAGLSVIVINDQGAIWYASSGAPFPRTLLQGDAARQKKMAQWEQDKRSYYGQIVTLPVGREAKPYQVAISLDITHHRVFMDEFHRLLALSMVLAVLGTTGLGWVATRRGLKPLHEVTGMVSTLSASKLTERLPATRIPHELHDLVFAFNAMLGRLEESFLRLSHFSSDIAHELRTPISNLMTQTQVVLTKARDAGEYREILYSNLEEYQRLAAMIADMLFLAKADNGLIIPSRAPVDLAAEARDLFTYYEALAEEQGVALAEMAKAA